MEAIGFLLQIVLTILALLVVFFLPLFLIARKKKLVEKLDYYFPFIPILFYLLLNVLGISKQSLTNFAIETLVVIIATAIGFGIKVFTPFKKSRIILIILLVFVLLFCLSMLLILE
jgi:hypothetical protein